MANTLNLIISFLGGGVIGAVIQWARTARSERERRHSEYISEQLNKLYGPLYFLTSQNQELFALNSNILNVYKEHFEKSEWRNDPVTKESLRKESEATIQLANAYIDQVVINNEKIAETLHGNYAYIDAEDTQIIQEFVIDTIRMNKEIKEGRIKSIPYEVYKSLGIISYSKPEFLSLISDKFHEKQRVLKKYH